MNRAEAGGVPPLSVGTILRKPHVDVNTVKDFVINFLAIVWEALPFIVVGALIAGILEELLPQEALAKILPKHFVPAVLIGAALGLIFPMCECGIVVVMRRLLRKGLPLSCCVAYMLAGPIINPIVIGSTFVAFFPHQTPDGMSLGLPVVFLRCGIGYVVACVAGFIVHWLDSRSKKSDLLTAVAMPPAAVVSKLSLNVVDGPVEATQAVKKPVMQRIANISSTALSDFIDITTFLLIGSMIAAVIKTNPEWIIEVEKLSNAQPLLAIPVLMLLAFVLCLCSEADAFLAASFTKMSISAKLAFLVFGPMLDIKLLLMYTRVFKPKLIVTIISAVAVQVLLYSSVLHFAYNPSVFGGSVLGTPASPAPAGTAAPAVSPTASAAPTATPAPSPK